MRDKKKYEYNKQFHHVLVSHDTWEKLRRCGYAGDSFNDVILKLIESYNKKS